MIVYKNQILNFEDFILIIYIVNNYCNTYFKDFAFNFLCIKDLKTLFFCFLTLV